MDGVCRDIRDDMDAIRGILGVCPQHDVLFDDLTVRARQCHIFLILTSP